MRLPELFRQPQNTAELVVLLRIGALSIPLTALAYVFIYSLNGVRHFGRQAIALGSLNAFKLTEILIVIAIAGASAGSAAIGIVGGLLSLQIVLNFSLIPRHQMWGVMISILSVSILAGVAMMIYTFKALG